MRVYSGDAVRFGFLERSLGDFGASPLSLFRDRNFEYSSRVEPGSQCPVSGAVANETIESMPRAIGAARRSSPLPSRNFSYAKLLLLQIELLSKSLRVLLIQRPRCVLLQAIQRRGC